MHGVPSKLFDLSVQIGHQGFRQNRRLARLLAAGRALLQRAGVLDALPRPNRLRTRQSGVTGNEWEPFPVQGGAATESDRGDADAKQRLNRQMA